MPIRSYAEVQGFEGGYLPNEEQSLLIKAALRSDDRAVEAWRAWVAGVDFDTVDMGSQRLLPIVYHNLKDRLEGDPVLDRCRSIHRRFWYRNNLLLNAAAGAVRALSSKGIETLITKGAALAVSVFPDVGMRPMEDVDVLVPTERAREAIELLRAEGWTPMSRPVDAITDEWLAVSRALSMRAPSGLELDIDLHWHLFVECIFEGSDDPFWEHARPFALMGASCKTLAPTDHLLHACVHGIAWNRIPSIRWITDAAWIIRHEPEAIDWDRLLKLAARYRYTLRVREAFDYLTKEVALPIPDDVLQRLRSAKVERQETREFRRVTRPSHPHDGLRMLGHYWSAIARAHRHRAFPVKMLKFWNFLRIEWHVGTVLTLPFVAGKKGANIALRWLRGTA